MRWALGAAELGPQPVEGGGVAIVAVHVTQQASQPGECLAVNALLGASQAVAGVGPELLQVPSRLGDADDGHVQPPTADQRLQGRKDLLVSEIARHAEDHQSVGPGSGRTGIPDGTAAGGRGHLRCVGH